MDSIDTTTAPRRPFVLLPLYIYPTSASWEPLFQAAQYHPSLDFVVIVNPANGPGDTPLPDNNYTAVLQTLSSISNVKILGYIYCNYGLRPVPGIERDIRTYQGWTDQKRSITRIDGIFFDEVPSRTNECLEYMIRVSTIARHNLPGGIVIYNPGVFVDVSCYDSADFIVAFENDISQWNSSDVKTNLAMLPAELRGRSVAVAHSAKCSEEQLNFAEDVFMNAGFVGQFAATVPGYTEWCPNWEPYIRKLHEACQAWQSGHEMNRSKTP
ncbi:putative cell surface spherulin 4-like protein [Diplogelasinospora grovesii]|uniref:Cell surface spherulin 4-like protein n=1 Tax=Diplogelasinospora grovesii TaxID=303347 RepID=A0AAN6S315_9PEZI|nr:putative cell surface spherulin 4-like protein [Diplogelasinospora grovesii]